MLQAAAKNFEALAALRALAGAAEACSDPSFMLITSMWYTRRQQVSTSILYAVLSDCVFLTQPQFNSLFGSASGIQRMALA